VKLCWRKSVVVEELTKSATKDIFNSKNKDNEKYMKLSKILIILILVFSCKFAFSEGVIVRGQLDCGQWIEGRSEKNSIAFEHFQKLLGLL